MTKLNVSPNEVDCFYDKELADSEAKELSNPNSRHRTILKILKIVGLKPASTDIKIGCSIGSLSRATINYLSAGFFAGAEISSQPIELVKKKYSTQGKADFVVTYMANFSYAKRFDFIVFPDVLECIPVVLHSLIFNTVNGFVDDNSVILINKPEPLALDWMRGNRIDLQ